MGDADSCRVGGCWWGGGGAMGGCRVGWDGGEMEVVGWVGGGGELGQCGGCRVGWDGGQVKVGFSLGG